MSNRIRVEKLALVAILMGMAFLFSSSATIAQTDTQPRVLHNACVANCVLDTNFLHANMGNNMAKNAYHAWYDTYYTLTGCDDPAWKTDLLFLFDLIGDMVGAPGAPTMQCWQGLVAQAAGCSETCSDYFLPDANYAPNLRLSILAGTPGSLEVSLNNQIHTETLPERETLAYTRRFPLRTYLYRNDGTALLVDESEMPSLSFPNWITQGGYSDCVTTYGADNNRCTLLESLVTPSEISASADFMDGVLYDLSNQITSQDGVSGSFGQDGFVILFSDEDTITLKQGPFAGVVWSKTHNKSTGAHTQTIQYWNTQDNSLTITNHECDAFYCGVFGDRTETDTYVFALQGPTECRLPGNYAVQVMADLAHEKDFSDNAASYSYDADALGSADIDPTAEPPEQSIALEDLPVIDLPGPGIYPNTLSPGIPGLMYRLSIPQGIHFMFVRLVSMDGNNYDAFIRRGEIPVPEYPKINDDYICWIQADVEYSGGCPFTSPAPGSYYIFVPNHLGGSFQLEVEWTTDAQSATQIAEATRTAQATQTAGGGGEIASDTDSEIEANNSRATANPWNMQQPFTGKISKWSDTDYIFLTFPEPGIYTFAVDQVGQEMRVKLSLYRASSGNYLASANAPAPGSSTTLTMDASAGETYCLKVSALAMPSEITDQPYSLMLTDFVSDPYETNDNRTLATLWDLTEGSIQGYFWDKTTGREDFYSFTVPNTLDGSPVTFELSNPSPEMRVRLYLMRGNGNLLATSGLSSPGQDIQLTHTVMPGQIYYLRLTNNGTTSLNPYTLSALYTPAESTQGSTQNERPYRVHGLVYRQSGLLPDPLRGVSIFAQISGQEASLLDTTDFLGRFGGVLLIPEGQQVRVWAEQAGVTFYPNEEEWMPEERSRSHRVVFVATGTELIQTTHTPTQETIGTPLPPLLQTALATPSELIETPQPRFTATITNTPEPATLQTDTVISGNVWRLFAESEPAGVGAAQVVLSVNGVDQPAVVSQIDGTYRVRILGLQPGDQLSLRASNPEDVFEPAIYEWQAESGVDQWAFDFFSYWDEISSFGQMGPGRIHGRVTEGDGNGLGEVYLVVQMGSSDALQRIGPTDSDGYYNAEVTLPARMIVAVWVEEAGYLPSRAKFYQPYPAWDQEVNFWLP